jgi:hypothetical protein
MKPDDNTKTSGRALKSTSEIFKLLPNLPAERIPCVFGNALLAHLRQHHAVAARVVRKPLQKVQRGRYLDPEIVVQARARVWRALGKKSTPSRRARACERIRTDMKEKKNALCDNRVMEGL